MHIYIKFHNSHVKYICSVDIHTFESLETLTEHFLGTMFDK